MINSLSKRDFFARGLALSLGWHFIWFFLMVPVIQKQGYTPHAHRSIFLGSILKEGDFSFTDPVLKGEHVRSPISVKDLSRDGYFEKSYDLFVKPKAARRSTATIPALVYARPAVSSLVSPIVGDIQFGLLDYAYYLDHVEFAELKRISTREDVSECLDFRVLLGAAGVVRDIKKTSGSGDPGLDFYIMRKLKNAIFKENFAQGVWFGVRFKIKE